MSIIYAQKIRQNNDNSNMYNIRTIYVHTGRERECTHGEKLQLVSLGEGYIAINFTVLAKV